MNIVVIIPTYNEKESIAKTIDDLETVFSTIKNHQLKILVVDDSSPDGTADIVAHLAKKSKLIKLVKNPQKLGLGGAYIKGFKYAMENIGADAVFEYDADGSHQPADIPRLAGPIIEGRADMVIASRLRGGSDEFHGTLDNIVRQTGGALISLMLLWRWKADITDCENGFRAVDTAKARQLGLRSDGFLIEQEMVIKAIKQGLVIKEIASHEFSRQGGVSKLKTSQGWKFLWHIFKEMIF